MLLSKQTMLQSCDAHKLTSEQSYTNTAGAADLQMCSVTRHNETDLSLGFLRPSRLRRLPLVALPMLGPSAAMPCPCPCPLPLSSVTSAINCLQASHIHSALLHHIYYRAFNQGVTLLACQSSKSFWPANQSNSQSVST